MEPLYHDGELEFSWRPAYWFKNPTHGDLVLFWLEDILCVKRVIAIEGETIEVRNGKVYVDSKEAYEPYVKYCGQWNMPSLKVRKGAVFVMPDNRSLSNAPEISRQINISRIVGRPL